MIIHEIDFVSNWHFMMIDYGDKQCTSQEEGVDPLEEIDPYPGDDEVKEVEVDPLADPLGGVSPPRVEEGPVSPPRADGGTASNLGAVILG